MHLNFNLIIIHNLIKMEFNPYDKMPVLLDIGLRFTKIGIAGEPLP